MILHADVLDHSVFICEHKSTFMLREQELERGSDPTAGGAKGLAETPKAAQGAHMKNQQKASWCDDSAAAGICNGEQICL